MADLIDRAAPLKLFDERLDASHIQACTRQTGKTLWSGIKAGVNWSRNTVIEAPAVNPFEHLQEMICEGCNQQFSNEPCEPDECLILAALRTYAKETDFCSYGERRTDADNRC